MERRRTLFRLAIAAGLSLTWGCTSSGGSASDVGIARRDAAIAIDGTDTPLDTGTETRVDLGLVLDLGHAGDSSVIPDARVTDIPDAGVTDDGSCDPSISAAERARYEAAAAYSDALDGAALLVEKCGTIVYEHYVAPTDATSLHLLASGTKSFNCALFALAEADGLWSLDERVADTISEWSADPRKSQIRVEHLLSMSSGLRDSSLYNPVLVRLLDTYALAINDSTAEYAPGQACIYAPANFQVLAALFERKSGGKDPVQYLYDRLLKKLGFDATHLGSWTRDLDNNPQMAGGAYFTAREWASYGQLLLQRGRWNGEQLLSAAAVDRCVTYQNTAFLGYGLSWWLNRPTQGTLTPGVDDLPNDGIGDGDQIASTAPDDMYMAAGTGKQRLYVIPSLNLVVVHYAWSINDPRWTDHTFLGTLLGTGP